MKELKEKDKILAYDTSTANKSLNRMMCLEAWYDEYFAINEVFSKEEIQQMSDKEIDDLERLANGIAEGLY